MCVVTMLPSYEVVISGMLGESVSGFPDLPKPMREIATSVGIVY